MRKVTTLIALGLILASCGPSYDKSQEDWRDEVCSCVQEKGPENCAEVMKELRNYYGDDYKTHDRTTHMITQSCPEIIFSLRENK